MFKITPRRIVKFAASIAVTSAAMSATDAVVNTVTDGENENPFPAAMAGVTACWLSAPYTDAIVDRVADWRPRRKNQNETPEVAAVI